MRSKLIHADSPIKLARASGLASGFALRSSRARTTRVGGFTLLEVIVAVAAVAVISVGVASILNAVGKTVTGGRRISYLTQYSALVESQMRADFESMTRDGFLVIRNQSIDLNQNLEIDSGDAIAVSADDINPRPRRADEIIFFVRRGTATDVNLERQSTNRWTYASQRSPVLPNLKVESNTARVYYGHGRRLRVEGGVGSFQYPPPSVGVVDDNPDSQLGADVPDNPNRFASDWTLLRSVLVLSSPKTTTQARITAPVFGIDPNSTAGIARLSDSKIQVGLQPAVPSVFRAINRTIPGQTAATNQFRTPVAPFTGVDNPNRPQMGSGLVDIASTSLEEIRNIVTTLPDFPRDITQPSDLAPWVPSIATLYPNLQNGEFVTQGNTSLDRQHAWMRDAFPASSLNQALSFESEVSNIAPPFSRMRYELDLKDLIPVLAQAPGNDEQAKERFLASADQLMLTSSNFVPRCTEFLVEWSYGDVDETGQMTWHGLWRQADLDGNGTIDNNEWVTRPYPLNRAGDQVPQTQPVFINGLTFGGGGIPWPVSARLIHGNAEVGLPGTQPTVALDSYFGYTDPTLPIDFSQFVGVSDANGDGDPMNDQFDASPGNQSVPWKWPELIRVSMTLSDPQDLKIETTFQYVFTTPKQTR